MGTEINHLEIKQYKSAAIRSWKPQKQLNPVYTYTHVPTPQSIEQRALTDRFISGPAHLHAPFLPHDTEGCAPNKQKSLGGGLEFRHPCRRVRAGAAAIVTQIMAWSPEAGSDPSQKGSNKTRAAAGTRARAHQRKRKSREKYCDPRQRCLTIRFVCACAELGCAPRRVRASATLYCMAPTAASIHSWWFSFFRQGLKFFFWRWTRAPFKLLLFYTLLSQTKSIIPFFNLY